MTFCGHSYISRLFRPKPFPPLGFVWKEKGQVHLRSSNLLATPHPQHRAQSHLSWVLLLQPAA